MDRGQFVQTHSRCRLKTHRMEFSLRSKGQARRKWLGRDNQRDVGDQNLNRTDAPSQQQHGTKLHSWNIPEWELG